ncbi:MULTISPECIES: iron uptake porin [Prochlorococcus]|uniref:iron uptake porin n=1 Tax=Prochlorococcus TaxID=1218 RepID=UPI00053391E6|nr:MULTISPECIES: iron uptake porin [Prochlorococcus]KGG12081.1 putative porin precursor [Prochlorococcus sp. MIT 0601]
MKLFQQLLVIPAALGLVAPLAANAAEVNMTDVSKYASKPAKKLKAPSSSQFSDIVPGDWAYTALQNLSDSYGCVDNSYTQNLKSGLALTRYEAAALVNACFENGLMANAEGVSSDASLLAEEFGVEMAILKGRVDGLEYKLNELSAGQFASTTKLKGRAAFVVGGVNYDSNADAAVDHGDKISGTYSYRIELNSSFTGTDRLYTRLMTGNMGTSNPWGDKDGGTYLAVANGNSDIIEVDKLWYEWTHGEVKYWAGPKIENYYMLATAPSIYKPVLKQFALGGNGATYGSSTSPGFGAAWTQPTDSYTDKRWTVSLNHASSSGSDADAGILTDTESKTLGQVSYGNHRWQIIAAVAHHGCDEADNCKNWSDYYSTAAGNDVTGEGEDAYALRYYWKPAETGAIPAFQLGFDWRTLNEPDNNEIKRTASWMAGLMWKDFMNSGNRAGLAFGSRQHATSYEGTTGEDDAEDNFVWEVYYDYKVSDGITVTPALFGGSEVYDGSDDNIIGALVQTTFKF